MFHRYLSILIILLAIIPACSKKQQELPASPAAEPIPQQAQDAPDPVQPQAPSVPPRELTKLEQLTKDAESKSPESIEALANYLFDDSQTDYDYVRGCEVLRQIDIYTTPDLTFRRGWCDDLKGRTDNNQILMEQGKVRLKMAADQNYIPAMQQLIDSGMDTDMSAFRQLMDLYKKQAEETKSPEAQYHYATMLLSLPGDPDPEAAELLKTAADANYIPAIRALGMMYDHNEEKHSEGRSLLEKAATLGDPEAITALVSSYDFAARTAKTKEEKDSNTEQMLHWCEKSPGQILSCRILLETASSENERFRTQARNDLIPCMKNLEPVRWKCDRMKDFIERDSYVDSFPEDLKHGIYQELINCYEKVIRHGDGHPAMMGEITPTNRSVIESIKARNLKK